MHLGKLFSKLGLGKRHLFFALLSIFVTIFTISIWIYQLNSSPIVTKAAAATCYWVGDTNPANWNDASHWDASSGGAGGDCDGGVVPGADDTVVFDSANSNQVSVDTIVTVAAVTNTNYVGTLLLNEYNFTTNGNFNFKSGNLNLGSATLEVTGIVDLRGTAVTAGTSNLIMSGGSNTAIYGGNNTLNNFTINSRKNIPYVATKTSDFSLNGTFSVIDGVRFEFNLGTTVTLNKGAILNLNSTGELYRAAADSFIKLKDATSSTIPSGGTIGISVNFITDTQDIVIYPRYYGRALYITNESANNYIATLGTAVGQTLQIGSASGAAGSGIFYIYANGVGNITVDATTYNPSVVVDGRGDAGTGNFDFTGAGAGTEIINAGNGTWTIDGNLNFTDGQFNAGNSAVVFRSGGGQNPTLTSAGNSFYNLSYVPTSVSKTLTFADSVTVSNVLGCTGSTYTPTLKFTAGQTYTVNTIAINGYYNGVTYYRVTIKSSVDTSSFNFNVSQTKPRVTYVNVRDANSAGGNTINAAYSVDTVPGSTTNWTFLSTYTVSGTVYAAEDKGSNIGAAKTIGISIGGSPKETVESGVGGTFSFTVAFGDGEAMTIFEDDEGAEEMTLVTEAATPAANIAGLEAYTSKVVLSHASAGPMTNAVMDYADSTFDDDIKYTITSGNATIIAGFELWIDATKTYTPGGTVDADGIDINGTFTMGANAVSNSGDWDATGGSFTSSGTVTMDGAVAQTLTSNTNSFSGLTIKTTHASGTILADALSVSGNLYLSADGVSNVLLDAATNDPTVTVTGNVDYTGVGAGSESISMGDGTWTVGGNIDLTGGTITAGSSTLALNGTTALTSASQTFNNVQVGTAGAGGILTTADNMHIDGTLSAQNGGATTLNISDDTITLSSIVTLTNLDTFTTTNSTVIFDGTTSLTSATLAFNNVQIGTAGLGGSLTLADTATLSGNLTVLNGGATTLNLTNQTLNNAGATVNLTNLDTFTTTGSTLNLNSSSPQTLTSASKSFNNLTLTNTNAVSGVTFADDCTVTGTFTNTTSDSIVTFNDGSTYNFNAINLAGTAGHLINLVSATPGTAWLLNVTEVTPTADYVSATDSDASGGSAIDATTGGFNGGGNTNWLFAVATVNVAPASVTLDQGGTQAFTATAADAEGYNVPTATFTWSVAAGGGTISAVGLFTAGTTAGTYTNTVQATSSGINGTASVTVNAASTPTPEPTPEPSGDVCILGNITQVSIQDGNFFVAPAGVKTLGITFLDVAGNPVDKSSVANFKMTPDYGNSYWNIVSGGGRLADENLDTINTNFVGGGTRGSFSNTIIFSACDGSLKAYATPNIIKQKTIYADMEPETFALQPGESFNFSVSLFDDVQEPVDESCSYSWSLSNASGASIESPASKSTRITGQAVGEYDITVNASCPSGSAKDSSTLAVVKIDENTEWKLSNYFSSITSWEGQKTYVGFVPYIKVGAKWYSRAESLDYKMADPAAARVTGLHPNYPNIPIVEALKAGCYPFQVQATLNRFGKSYFASTNMNIGSSDKSSYYNQFQPTLGSSTLTYQHLVKTNGERYLNLNRNSAAGQSYSNYNWIYFGKPMTTSWIVNDTRIGTLRPYYNASYLDMTNSEYGYFPRALTTIVNFNGQKKIENWDIWIEKSGDKIRFSPSLPESIRIKPNSHFRLWQGYEYANWGEQILAGYKVKSLNQTAASVVNGDVTDIIFKSGAEEGTYQDAITLSSAYSASSMIGGNERKITLIVDNNATADLCSANGFAQVLGVQSDISENQDSQNSEKSIGDILRDIWNAIVEAVQNMFRWLNNHPVTSLIIGFLLALPALLSILGTTVLGNLITSISRFFTGLTAAAIPGKKNRRLGYVYDWQNKKPIRGARVSAFNTFSKKLSYQTVTNSQGEFILVLPQGEYYLTVEKRGYKPYQTVSVESGESFNGKRSDGYYEAIYLPSEKIDIASGQDGFAHSIAIPLSRPAYKPNIFLVAIIKLGGFISRMSLFFLIIGSLMTVGLVIYDNSNWINIIILLYYILVWILYLYRHFTFFSGTASVVDQNGAGVDLALIRVFNNQSKLIQTVVSDRKGHFILNLVKGNYTLQVRKAGFAALELPLGVKNLADINKIKIALY